MGDASLADEIGRGLQTVAFAIEDGWLYFRRNVLHAVEPERRMAPAADRTRLIRPPAMVQNSLRRMARETGAQVSFKTDPGGEYWQAEIKLNGMQAKMTLPVSPRDHLSGGHKGGGWGAGMGDTYELRAETEHLPPLANPVVDKRQLTDRPGLQPPRYTTISRAVPTVLSKDPSARAKIVGQPLGYRAFGGKSPAEIAEDRANLDGFSHRILRCVYGDYPITRLPAP